MGRSPMIINYCLNINSQNSLLIKSFWDSKDLFSKKSLAGYGAVPHDENYCLKYSEKLLAELCF